MRTLIDFAINQIYERLRDLGDKPVSTGNSMEWECFRPLLESLCDSKTGRRGRPNIDIIIMLKALLFNSSMTSLMSSSNGN